jgi:hypothetical protein
MHVACKHGSIGHVALEGPCAGRLTTSLLAGGAAAAVSGQRKAREEIFVRQALLAREMMKMGVPGV